MAKKSKPRKATRGFNKQEQAFVAHYLLHHNAAEAYGVGYPASKKNTAAYRAKEGAKLLKRPHIASIVTARVEKMAAAAEKKFDITAERVLQELAALAYANSDDYYVWGAREKKVVDKKGNPVLDANGQQVVKIESFAYVKPSDSLSRVQKAAIVGAEMSFTRDGTPVVGVKMADKRGALGDLAKYLKLFSERVEHTGLNGGPIQQEHRTPDLVGIADPRDALKAFESFRAKLRLGNGANGHA